jgi:hypothetical protein
VPAAGEAAAGSCCHVSGRTGACRPGRPHCVLRSQSCRPPATHSLSHHRAPHHAATGTWMHCSSPCVSRRLLGVHSWRHRSVWGPQTCHATACAPASCTEHACSPCCCRAGCRGEQRAAQHQGCPGAGSQGGGGAGRARRTGGSRSRPLAERAPRPGGLGAVPCTGEQLCLWCRVCWQLSGSCLVCA